MIISDLAVKKRTTVFAMVLFIIITGLISYVNLPRESAPDIPIPMVFVQTMYRGVSPEDIEKSITIEIEKKLKGLEGVKKISSTSAEGLSSIVVEFMTDVDIDDALIKVKDKVDLAKPELPTDLDEEPSVFEVNFSEMPILVLSLSGSIGMRHLTNIAEDLEEEIESIKGVLEVDVVGGVTREIQIQVDPQRMALYGIPFTSLQQVVSGENANVSGGSIRTSEGKYQLRVPGEFKTVGEVESIVIGTNNDQPIYLRDVAIVKDGIEDRESYSRTNGRDAVTLYIKKRSGENIIYIVDAVNETLERMSQSWPAGVKLIRVDDRSKEIKNMVADLENNILTGLLLVIVVVMFAMGLRNAILVSLSIPLSMLISFVIISMMGITLNMVVLFSLTLALGMLVDNAIVIIENIYRFIQQGVPRTEAAMRATSEVAWPIIGSSLTTIFAFTPLLVWDGLMGSFMVYLPLTVIITLCSCLFVALIINPAMAAVLMKESKNGKSATADEIMSGGEHPMLSGGGIILETYRKVLRGALRFRMAVVLLASIIMLVMIQFWLLRGGLKNSVEFFPAIDPPSAWVAIRPPEGADLDHIDQIVKEIACRVYSDKAGSAEELAGKIKRLRYEESINPVEKTKLSSKEKYQSYTTLPNTEFIYEKSSSQGTVSTGFSDGGGNNQVGLKFVDLADRVDENGEYLPTTKTIELLEERMRDIPGGEVTVEKSKEGPPTGSAINIEISGDEFETLGELAEKVKDIVATIPYTKNIRSSFEQGSPTIELQVERKRAALLGLSTQTIGFAIKAAINGIDVSTYREGDEDYDITVRFLEKDRRNIDTLRQIFIPSSTAGLVPLTTVAKISYTGGLGSITRINHSRVVTVSADVDETKTTGAVARIAAEKLLAGDPVLHAGDIKDTKQFAARLSGSPLLNSLAKDKKAELLDLCNSAMKSDDPDAKERAALLQAVNNWIAEATPQLSGQDRENLPEELVQALESPEHLSSKDRQKANRTLLELTFPDIIKKAPETINFPSGYHYTFTGEDEEQKKAQEFLSWAMGVALILILMTLVAMFNSVTKPLIIMSSVVLSLGGVFLGLGLHQMPFGVIMTGVGVISLAGVVVNNAIVLVDYIQQLIDRGLTMYDAIIAAGATRLRPVILTAVTTVLGLIPMVTGMSIDFQPLLYSGKLPEFQRYSESSQWWSSMAVAVIWGLIMATALTLIVVPVLFSLVDSFGRWVNRNRLAWFFGCSAIAILISPQVAALAIPVMLCFTKWFRLAIAYPVCYEWWNHFDKRHHTRYALKWADARDKLRRQG